MRIKPSAQKARERRNRNRRNQKMAANRTFRCEALESRVMLDGGGLLPDGFPFPLPEPPGPVPPLEPGAISGRVWVDADGNRELNGAEVGQGGVTVYSDLNFNGALDANEPSTITEFDDPVTDFDEGGLYTLSNLQPGWHNVRQVTPNGFEQTFPSLQPGYLPPPWGDASVHVTFVEQGQTVDDVNFSNKEIEPGAVTGIKWEDVNGNGLRDDGELGLPGVVIYSDENLNGVLDPDEPSTVTSEDDPFTDFDESGQYTLSSLEPGLHWIKEVVPDGFQQTFPNFWWFAGPAEGAPPTDALFAPIPFPGGGWHDVVIESGQTVDGIDFGNQRIVFGSVSGVKWEDVDGDGVRGADEPGLAGVTIYADLNFNAELDADEPFAITTADIPETDFDEGGRYTLAVDPGAYYIREVVPDGYRQTFPNAGFPTPWLPPVGILPPQDGAHYVIVNSGQAVEGIDFGNQLVVPGSISGVKWEDFNGNAERDPGEPGLAGVTIYADINGNGVLDANEPSAITTADLPETDFDEGGRYTLAGLDAGDYVIREVVPDGFRQTFPLPSGVPVPGTTDGIVADEFATVDPDRLDLLLAAGDVIIEEVTLTVNPAIFRPIEIDVFAQSADGSSVDMINLSGPQPNGGSGDVSVFQLMFVGTGEKFDGELSFFDTSPVLFAAPIASIPLTVGANSPGEGVHRVTLGAGENLEGIDFGNQRIEPSTGVVSGRKWEDLNGNAEQDLNERGLAGVVIYADLNQNGFLDFTEPSTITSEDDPFTDFDEAGLYTLEVPTGEQWIAEVVPDGFEQTFPRNAVIAIFPPPPVEGVHFVTVESGQSIDGLDFGNRPVENGSVSGRKWADLNGNGDQDGNEQGLGGVTIYADLNFNGQLDVGEPSTITMDDIPETDFDECGLYSLSTRPGFQAIREVVPDGYFQTYPVSDALSPLEQGAHFVNVVSGQNIDGLDFGNQPLDNFPGGVSGRKWEDLNGNGRRDANEPGLAGVTIYSDLNFNNRLDANEPSAVTMADIPETDFDEGGLYSIADLTPGFHTIREVLPDGFTQTFPISIAASPLESGAHFVFVGIGEQTEGLDFGNLRLDVPLPGDFNGDGVVDGVDLDVWEEGYGGGSSAAIQDAVPKMTGSDFLTWQLNHGRVAIAPPAAGENSLTSTADTAEPLPTGVLRATYRPTARESAAVVEAAFAEQPVSFQRVRAVELTPASTGNESSSETVSGAVAPRANYADLAAAIDAALEEDFGV